MSRAKIIGGTLAAAVTLAAPMGAYYEGVLPVGYADPVGIPTDCVGETDGAIIGVQRFTVEECVARYSVRLARNWTHGLANCIHRDVTVPQVGALISWSDNVGIHAACTSTLVRMLNAGAKPAVWCAQLTRWNKATIVGVTIVLPGLNKRRAAERAMCLGNDWRAPAGYPA